MENQIHVKVSDYNFDVSFFANMIQSLSTERKNRTNVSDDIGTGKTVATASRTLEFFWVLVTTLSCSKTVLAR